MIFCVEVWYNCQHLKVCCAAGICAASGQALTGLILKCGDEINGGLCAGASCLTGKMQIA